MKNVMMIAMSVMLVFVFSPELNAQDADNNGEVVLETSMDCGNCAGKVTKQLSFTKGVKDVKADFVKDEVWVKFRSDKTDVDKLIASLDEIGYKASVKGENSDNNKKDKHAGCPGAKTAGCAGKDKPCGAAKDE